MIEKLLWYLLALDCLVYAAMTFSASYHSKKTHHFWKGIPLYWGMAVWYIVLVAWLGFALYRLGVLF